MEGGIFMIQALSAYVEGVFHVSILIATPFPPRLMSIDTYKQNHETSMAKKNDIYKIRQSMGWSHIEFMATYTIVLIILVLIDKH